MENNQTVAKIKQIVPHVNLKICWDNYIRKYSYLGYSMSA
jgi:hypothetical protein